MAKVYSIAIYKGGTSKTTTAAALISGLTKRGKKVLGIDLDPQCNLITLISILRNLLLMCISIRATL